MTSGPSIPRSQRKRPEITLTLAAEAHEALERIPRGKRSEYVSELILDDAHGANGIQSDSLSSAENCDAKNSTESKG